ncbi:MAG TPA: ABC transporter permease, partial [Anaerolineae bacterium]|nr:ABC transporter permease [Anaerolineae bacterium]
MGQYILRRLLHMVPVLFGVSVLVFSFVHLIPGDPAVAMLGERASEENVTRIREQLGLDKPLYQQYLIFIGRFARGDLGRSIHSRNPISDELKRRFPATAELSLSAITIAVLLGIPAGIISAIKRNSIFDNLSMVGALMGVSMPIFWLGLMLLWLFAVKIPWFPTGTRLDVDIHLETRTNLYVLDSLLTGNWEALVNSLKHLILPSIALGTIPLATIARMTRSAMLEVLGQEYVRTAKAKGLPPRLVILRHALRNALLPVVTVIGLQVGLLLSGAILTETIFSWPGIGKWIYDAIV